MNNDLQIEPVLISELYKKPKELNVSTGLFNKRTSVSEQTWLGDGITLFDLYHGYCWYYAQFYRHLNPKWKMISLNSADKECIIHAFCTTMKNQKRLFADARGITDDPKKFFKDFGLNKKVIPEEELLTVDLSWFNRSYWDAYSLVHDDNVIIQMNSKITDLRR